MAAVVGSPIGGWCRGIVICGGGPAVGLLIVEGVSAGTWGCCIAVVAGMPPLPGGGGIKAGCGIPGGGCPAIIGLYIAVKPGG